MRPLPAAASRRAPRRPWLAAACLALAAAAALSGPPGPLAARPVQAAGSIIVVTTTSDAEFPGDGLCSLRAAIKASNVGGYAGYCTAGTASADSIRFDIGTGTPSIVVLTDLPSITQPATIRGNTGGATRVNLFGPGAGTGLHVSAAATQVRAMDIQNFDVGIYVDADGVTVAGNRIHLNKNIGIYSVNPGITIGGTVGVTPGGACTGDCNLVQDNPTGISAQSGGTIQGNVVGTNEAGTAAAPNGKGVIVNYGTWLVGGTAAGAGNLISGSTTDGLQVFNCDACTIQGNRIGTNVAGTAALPNARGIYVVNGDGTTIGGSVAGAGNIVAANTGHGIFAATVGHLTIQGNRIGVGASGGALGNGGAGIGTGFSASGVSDMTIGSATNPLAANIIANNGAAGISILGTGSTFDANHNAIRGNSIYNNIPRGIWLQSEANGGIDPPLIGSLGPVHGTACANCFVDVYSDSLDQGRRFEGTAQANGIGEWTFTGLFAGPNVTATAVDANGNTSEFSAAFAIPDPPFTDIGSSSFKSDIAWLYANGITKGCAATLYCPTAPVTREQMASFIAREFQLPAATKDWFTDDETSTHEANINRLAEAGITSGCTATTFCPLALVLRDQMASFLARAAGLTVGAGRDYFGDDNGNTHEANIDRAAAAGITTGCGSYLYCPGSGVTREQMAAFLRRVVTPVAPPPYPAP